MDEHSVFDLDHLPKTYLKLALPVVLGMVVTLVYNLADTYFIGQTNDANIVAGVSICAPLFTTIMAFGNIYGQGGSSLISRFLGKNDKEKVNHISSFCFYVAIITGLLLGIILLAFKSPLLKLLGATEQTLAHASDYYTVLAIGAPFCLLSFIHSNILRCEGLAKESMLGSMAGTITNIILDPIFISVLHMGAKGAAIATVIGYVVADLFLLFIVLKKSNFLSVDFKKIGITSNDLGQILGVGFTAAITNLTSSVCTILMNQQLVNYGVEKVAAMGIALKINMISQLVLVGFAFGAVPLYGYLFGANNTKKIKELVSFSIKFLGGLALALSLLLIVFAPSLVGAMLDNAGVISDGTAILRWQAAGSVFTAIVLITTCMFQATGKVTQALIMSLSRQGVIFIVVLLVLVNIFGYTGLIMAQFVSDLISALLGGYLVLKTFKF